MKWAKDMTTEQIRLELIELDQSILEFEAANDDDVAHGGSPGEGLYERHEELTVELAQRAAK